MTNALKFSYVLPDPSSYDDWSDFEGDLKCVKDAGYDAVELQITDPAHFNETRVRVSLEAAGLPLCAFQTGGTYASRGNCLCTADAPVRNRTIELLKSFVELAAKWKSTIVFGSLQGRLSNEPNREIGAERIRAAIKDVGRFASELGATLAFEPVQHGEVGFNNTIDEVAHLVRSLNMPGVRMMIDTFHMNIEERDLLTPISPIRDILAHVHLSETNRDVLGEGHWPTAIFLAELKRLDYHGYCSVGVYNTRKLRSESIFRCRQVLKECLTTASAVASSEKL
jgi:sugar phosphate isomerase/epimerase